MMYTTKLLIELPRHHVAGLTYLWEGPKTAKVAVPGIPLVAGVGRKAKAVRLSDEEILDRVSDELARFHDMLVDDGLIPRRR